MKKLRPRLSEIVGRISNKQIEIVVLLLFLIGSRDFDNYGISTDEKQQRLIGFVNLRYILENLHINHTWLSISDIPDLENFGDSIFGSSFEVVLVLIESIFKPKTFNGVFDLRHLVTHFFFLTALYIFAKTVQNHFKSNPLTFLSMSLFLGNPRIYSESFFNSKDIVVMSFFMITLSVFIRYLRAPTNINLLLLGFVIGLSTSIRLSGIIWAPYVVLLLLRGSLQKDIDLKSKIKALLIFCSSVLFSTILFFPFLWSNPIRNMLIALIKFSQYPSNLDMLYKGDVINSEKLPVDYIFTWFFITTPLTFCLLFCLGSALSIYFYVRRKKIVKDDITWHLLTVSLYIIFSSITIVLILNSSLYNGWRHLYFVYPEIVMVTIVGISLLLTNFGKKIGYIVFIFVFAATFSNFHWQQINSPVSSLYFNESASKGTEKKFDIDYWGVANKRILGEILEDSNLKLISIYNLNNTPIEFSVEMLSVEESSRIKLVDHASDADYLIQTYQVDRRFEFEALPVNAKLWYDFRLEDFSVARIYKLAH